MTDKVRFLEFLQDTEIGFKIIQVGPFVTIELNGKKVVGNAEVFWTFDKAGTLVGTGAEA